MLSDRRNEPRREQCHYVPAAQASIYGTESDNKLSTVTIRVLA